MVKAFHDAGIGVVMDVVYNHTYAPFGQGGSQNDFQKKQYSPLDRTVPGYYYTSTDWSGCGNSTDSTKEMYRKYMIDSIVYWATEYHLDGFRFDLTAQPAPEAEPCAPDKAIPPDGPRRIS